MGKDILKRKDIIMSKMSQLNAMLTEQAYELGYESLEQAFDNGWEVDYEHEVLVKRVDILEQAHKDWLKEREEVIKSLERAIEFIRGCEL